jgi:exopolyphosphatase/guanosine-5'-triphosphate,3'-diphosphate pyrophosphatase
VHAVRRAVIDVGTNSIKLLIADVQGRNLTPLIEQSNQTRLGSGFYESQRLQPGPIKATADAVASFAQKARELGALSIRVIGTSAAREALNAAELLTAIRAASGIDLEIISGDEEADLAFRGVTTDSRLSSAPLLLLDVGGGSTEFILGQGNQKHFQRSFPIGTVRLLEKLPHSDPPTPQELENCRAWLRHYLNHEVRSALEPAMRMETKLHASRSPLRLVGTGGTTTLLARMEAEMTDYDRDRIEQAVLCLECVTRRVNQLWSLPLEERKKIIGLPANRADVILLGTVIYEAVMLEFGLPELRVSTRGLRFAALL